MRRVIPLAVATMLIGVFAGAELSEPFREWPKGPAGFLLTKKEKKEYGKLTTDAQAQAFIDLFWARRDPDLETAINEFKVQFDQRVEYADANFGYGKTPGWMTDRGRTLILLGPWAHQSALPPSQTARRLESETEANAPSDEGAGAEIWIYRRDQLPGAVRDDLKADQITFIFLQSRIGIDDYQFARSDSRMVAAMRVLSDMPDALLLHPDLKEVPRLGLLRGSKAATAGELAIFAAEPRPWPEGTVVRTTTGIQSESSYCLWLFVRVPGTAPAANRVVGRVRGADGSETGTFSRAIAPLPTGDGNAYELSIPVDAGKWFVDLALLGEGGPVAVSTVEAEREAVETSSTYISPLIWGSDVRQEVNAHLGDPFNVGGWHALPNIGDRYRNQDSVSYFCYVVRPGLAAPQGATGEGATAEPQPNMELLVQVSVDGKVLGQLPPQKVTLSRVFGDVWMFGHALPLSGFRKEGAYLLEVTLRDTISGASRAAQIPLNVVVGGQS